MGINIITSAMSASVYAHEQIPQYLKSQLIELGISPDEVQSASEARALIEQAKTKKQQQADNKQNAQTQTGTGQKEELPELMQKAINLAEKVGVSVSENDTIDDITENIQAALDKLFEQAAKMNDEGMYNTLVGFQHQLDSIVAESNGGGQSQSTMLSFMDMLAKQNMMMLNFNYKNPAIMQ